MNENRHLNKNKILLYNILYDTKIFKSDVNAFVTGVRFPWVGKNKNMCHSAQFLYFVYFLRL